MPTTLLDFISDGSSKVNMKWKEQYVSEGLNRKMAISVPWGVYRGFRLTTNGAALTVGIQADTSGLDHVAVYQTSGGFSLEIRRTGGDFSLDLSAYASQVVILALYATYLVGSATTAILRAYTQAEFDVAVEKDELVVLGRVTVPASGVIAADSITHDLRRMAWQKKAPESVTWAPIVRNGGFEWTTTTTEEYGAAFWRKVTAVGSTWMGSATDPHSGKYCILFTYAGAAETGWLEQEVNIPVTAGQKIRVQLFKKMLQAATGGSLNLWLQYVDQTGTPIGSSPYPIDTTVDASYEEIDKIFTVPISAVHLRRVGLYVDAITFAASSAAFRVDDFQVWVEPTAESPYLQNERKGDEILTGLRLRDQEGNNTALEALLTMDKDSPATEGTLSVGTPRATGLPPVVEILGRLLNLGGGLRGTMADALKPRISASPGKSVV